MNRLGVFQLLVSNNAAWIGKAVNQMLGIDSQCCDMKMNYLWGSSRDKITICETYTGLILQVDLSGNGLLDSSIYFCYYTNRVSTLSR